MDLANTFLLCFICAGLTCLRNIISQRLRLKTHGCKCPMSGLSKRRADKENIDVAIAAQPVVQASPSTCHVPALGDACDTMVCKGDLSYVCSFISSNGSHLSDERSDVGCDSTACSARGSASSSQSSSQADSDRDSDGRSFPSSADWSDDDRPGTGCQPCCLDSPQSVMMLDQPCGQPRSATRLPRRSALSQPKAAGERRSKAKSVTFQARGAIICSAPTVEALSLLAAGTPPLPVTPSSCASWCISGNSVAPAPIANADSWQPVRAMDPYADASVSNESSRCPSSSSTTKNTPFLPAAPKSGQPVGGPVKQATASPQDHLVFPLRSLTPQLTIVSSEAGILCTDPVHASALARAAAGRRRVMAALEEARNHFSHLGRSQLPNSWPPAAHGISTAQQELQFQRQGSSGSGANDSCCPDQGSEMQRLTLPLPARLLPNLPLAPRDVGILAVGYASSTTAVSCEASITAVEVPWSEAQQGGAGEYGRGSQVIQHEISGRGGGDRNGRQCANAATVRCAHMAASSVVELFRGYRSSKRLGGLDWVIDLRGGSVITLSQLTASDRLRMAEVVAKQL